MKRCIFILSTAVFSFFLFSVQNEIRAQAPNELPSQNELPSGLQKPDQSEVKGALMQGSKKDPSMKQLEKELKKKKKKKNKKLKTEK